MIIIRLLGGIKRQALLYSKRRWMSTGFQPFEEQFVSIVENFRNPESMNVFSKLLDSNTERVSTSSDFNPCFLKFCKTLQSSNTNLDYFEAIPRFGMYVCDAYPGLADLFCTILPYSTELTEACYASYNIVQSEEVTGLYQQYLSTFTRAQQLKDIKQLPSVAVIPDYHRRFTLSQERVEKYNGICLNARDSDLHCFDEYFDDMEVELSDVEYQNNMILTQVQYTYENSKDSLLKYQGFLDVLNFLRRDRTQWLTNPPEANQTLFLHSLGHHSLSSDAFKFSNNLKFPPYLFAYLLQSKIKRSQTLLTNLITGASGPKVNFNNYATSHNIFQSLHPVVAAIVTEIGLTCATGHSNILLSVRRNK